MNTILSILLQEAKAVSVAGLAKKANLPVRDVESELSDLVNRGLVEEFPPSIGVLAGYRITESGRESVT